MTLAIHKIYHTIHSVASIFGGLLCPNIRAIRQYHIWFMQHSRSVRTYVSIVKGCDKDSFFHLHLLYLGKKWFFSCWTLCSDLFVSVCFLFVQLLTNQRKKRFILCLFASRAQSMHSFTEFGHKNEYLFTHLIFINKTMRLFFFFSLVFWSIISQDQRKFLWSVLWYGAAYFSYKTF